MSNEIVDVVLRVRLALFCLIRALPFGAVPLNDSVAVAVGDTNFFLRADRHFKGDCSFVKDEFVRCGG